MEGPNGTWKESSVAYAWARIAVNGKNTHRRLLLRPNTETREIKLASSSCRKEEISQEESVYLKRESVALNGGRVWSPRTWILREGSSPDKRRV